MPRDQAFQGSGRQPEVAAALVGFRAVTGRQRGIFQGAPMVGKEVGWHAKLGLQLSPWSGSSRKVKSQEARIYVRESEHL